MHIASSSHQIKPKAKRLLIPGVVAAMISVFLGACGGGTATERVHTGPESASALLKAWASFPIHASPRPLVLVGSPVGDPQKFLDEQAKLDYISGAFDGPASLPAGPSSANGYPVITANAALALLRSQLHGNVSGSTPSQPAVRLTITEARFGSGTFATDRGDRTLPAWLFTFTRAEGLVSVLAIAPAALWSPPGQAAPTQGGSSINGAIVSSDNRTLTVGLIGAAAGTGPCTSSYTLTLTESSTAVVATVTEISHSSAGTVCDLVGHLRKVSAVLDTPLGNRVLLDAVTGQPVEAIGAP
jgi:hypothetical protein